MTNIHITTWLWCQISIAKMYLDMLDYTDPVVVEHQESEGWTKQKIINMLEAIAEKANKIAKAATHIEHAPTASTELCICRMMQMGIKFDPAISVVTTRTNENGQQFLV